jgi:gamma-glutamyl-gamma-aminobutyrate hydrolase PuuD
MGLRVALATRSKEKGEPYRVALRMAGLESEWFVPGAGELPTSIGGLVLTGGTDVDPSLYRAAAAPETNTPDRERDDYESFLLRTALTRNLPVLAICRGLQLFNVAQGGTLIQHLPNTWKHKQNLGGTPIHDADVSGRMSEIFGAEKIRVNSRHHQAIEWLGEGMIATARDPEDGVIEGFVYPSARFAVGVQWHPEDMVDDDRQMGLFRAFAASVAEGRSDAAKVR